MHASFGLSKQAPHLQDQVIRDTAQSDCVISLDLAIAAHPAGIPGWRVAALGNDRFIGMGAMEPIPARLVTVLQRHAAQSSSIPAWTVRALPERGPLTASSIVHGCKARLFRYASLFVLDCGELVKHIIKRCPHSAAATVLDEVEASILAIVADFGLCLRLDATRLLCGFYSHTEADPELIASQLLLTLRKATCNAEIMNIHAKNFRLLDVSIEHAEHECAAFVDEL